MDIHTKIEHLENQIQTVMHELISIKSMLKEGLAHEIQAQNIKNNDFQQIKNTLESKQWPDAIHPELICDITNEKEKIERARGIVEYMIDEDLEEKKFLDYGCGEGHCVEIAKLLGAESWGYDIIYHERWNQQCTTQFEEIKKHAPYDIILLFDVIDHSKDEHPISILTKCKELLSHNGKIYMRTHPYVSKHAIHQYHEINKAYVHLVFFEEELPHILPPSNLYEYNNGVIYPLRTYQEYIHKSQLKIESCTPITEEVDEIFQNPEISARIIKKLKINELPLPQMSIQYVDYVLSSTVNT